MTRRGAEKKQSLETLKNLIQRGDTVYTILRHVSRSGMQREISVKLIKDNRPHDISFNVAEILGERQGKSGGIIVNGCGMDMGFDLVYRLSCALFCPDKYSHDAAYALKQEWL